MSPVAAYVLMAIFGDHTKYTFFIELAGIWAFSWYWWVKSQEMAETGAERLAASGQIANAPPGEWASRTAP